MLAESRKFHAVSFGCGCTRAPCWRRYPARTMAVLSDGLSTRIACGDWERVLTKVLLYSNLHRTQKRDWGFLDPPYSRQGICRTAGKARISARVREWAIAHGDNRAFESCSAAARRAHNA